MLGARRRPPSCYSMHEPLPSQRYAGSGTLVSVLQVATPRDQSREAKALQSDTPHEAPVILALQGVRRGNKNCTMPGARCRPPVTTTCVRHCLPSAMPGTRHPSLGTTRCAMREGVQTANNKHIPLQLGKGASNPK
ncbi:hypothetical protein HAX54_005424 [Datura stramonium]|uniref:Uncharacterized protein n=1 Tax=Datura stramonium TaxID=4076 RepID=A0ABS8RU85_DATST|nr:hypothetical protein [Datura stramonium]